MTTYNKLPEIVRTAPERIWLQVGDDAFGAFDGDGVSWCQDSIFANDIEYVRADRAEWPSPRPMSEAPKDVDVLAWWPRQRQWAETTWLDFCDKWTCDFATNSSPQPTHWLPMPPEPTEQEKTT